MKKTKILSFVLAIAIILPNFIGIPSLFADFFKNLFTIPATAWEASAADWVDDQISDPADGYAYSFAVVGDTQTLL